MLGFLQSKGFALQAMEAAAIWSMTPLEMAVTWLRCCETSWDLGATLRG